MDVVTLPLVTRDTEVDAALAKAKESRRSGVVVAWNPDEYRLFHAGDLLRARADAVGLIGNLQGGHAVVLVRPTDVVTHGVDVIHPQRTWNAYERMLDQTPASYALVGASSHDVMIVTRHEGQTAELSLTGGFECDGSPTHYFPAPSVSTGDDCPRYPHCQGPDGRPSRIRPA